MSKRNVILKVALGSVPVLALCLVSVNTARAQFTDIFISLTSTVTGIGQIVTTMGSIETQMSTLYQGNVYSPSVFASALGNGNTIVNSYRSWVGQVNAMPVNSAQLAASSAYEAQLLSAQPSDIQIQQNYQAAFGPLPTSSQVPSTVIAQVDMTDAQAMDAAKLSVLADSSSASAIAQGRTFENSVLSTTQGSAPQIEAAALAYEIQTMAVEHKLLASHLRSEGMELGSVGATYKRHGVVSQAGAGSIAPFN